MKGSVWWRTNRKKSCRQKESHEDASWNISCWTEENMLLFKKPDSKVDWVKTPTCTGSTQQNLWNVTHNIDFSLASTLIMIYSNIDASLTCIHVVLMVVRKLIVCKTGIKKKMLSQRKLPKTALNGWRSWKQFQTRPRRTWSKNLWKHPPIRSEPFGLSQSVITYSHS